MVQHSYQSSYFLLLTLIFLAALSHGHDRSKDTGFRTDLEKRFSDEIAQEPVEYNSIDGDGGSLGTKRDRQKPVDLAKAKKTKVQLSKMWKQESEILDQMTNIWKKHMKLRKQMEKVWWKLAEMANTK